MLSISRRRDETLTFVSPEAVDEFGLSDAFKRAVGDKVIERLIRAHGTYLDDQETNDAPPKPTWVLAGSFARNLLRPGNDVDLYAPYSTAAEALVDFVEAVERSPVGDPVKLEVDLKGAVSWGRPLQGSTEGFGLWVNAWEHDRYRGRLRVEINPGRGYCINTPLPASRPLSRYPGRKDVTYCRYSLEDSVIDKYLVVIRHTLIEKEALDPRTFLRRPTESILVRPTFRGQDFFDLVDMLVHQKISYQKARAAWLEKAPQLNVPLSVDFSVPQDPAFKREYQRLAAKYGDNKTPNYEAACNVAESFFNLMMTETAGPPWQASVKARLSKKERVHPERGEARALEPESVEDPALEDDHESRWGNDPTRLARGRPLAAIPQEGVQTWGLSDAMVRFAADQVLERLRNEFGLYDDSGTPIAILTGSLTLDSLRSPKDINLLFPEVDEETAKGRLASALEARDGDDLKLVPSLGSVVGQTRRLDSRMSGFGLWVDLKWKDRYLDRVWLESAVGRDLYINEPEERRNPLSGFAPGNSETLYLQHSRFDQVVEKLLTVMLRGAYEGSRRRDGKPWSWLTADNATRKKLAELSPRNRPQDYFDLVDILVHEDDIRLPEAAYALQQKAVQRGAHLIPEIVLPDGTDREYLGFVDCYGDGLMPGASKASEIVRKFHECLLKQSREAPVPGALRRWQCPEVFERDLAMPNRKPRRTLASWVSAEFSPLTAANFPRQPLPPARRSLALRSAPARHGRHRRHELS